MLPRRLLTPILVVVVIWIAGLAIPPLRGDAVRTYVGTEACRPCHPQECATFKTYSKKSRSYEMISQRKTITAEEFKKCLACHTTGYGQPGGFTSVEQTPHLKDVGCETCHGPGSLHAEGAKKADIQRRVSARQCDGCHDETRVASFRFKPLIYGGVH